MVKFTNFLNFAHKCSKIFNKKKNIYPGNPNSPYYVPLKKEKKICSKQSRTAETSSSAN
jgi:hypothetical protein